jgi:hypothetical protein
LKLRTSRRRSDGKAPQIQAEHSLPQIDSLQGRLFRGHGQRGEHLLQIRDRQFPRTRSHHQSRPRQALTPGLWDFDLLSPVMRAPGGVRTDATPPLTTQANSVPSPPGQTARQAHLEQPWSWSLLAQRTNCGSPPLTALAATFSSASVPLPARPIRSSFPATSPLIRGIIWEPASWEPAAPSPSRTQEQPSYPAAFIVSSSCREESPAPDDRHSRASLRPRLRARVWDRLCSRVVRQVDRFFFLSFPVSSSGSSSETSLVREDGAMAEQLLESNLS